MPLLIPYLRFVVTYNHPNVATVIAWELGAFVGGLFFVRELELHTVHPNVATGTSRDIRTGKLGLVKLVGYERKKELDIIGRSCGDADR